jgi:hypothetical protein
LSIEHGSLDQEAFGEMAGGNFDLIVAHDVMQRVSDPLAAMTNLAVAAGPTAPVYVSLRGEGSCYGRIERALEAFGIALPDMAEAGEEVWAIARMVSALGGLVPGNRGDLLPLCERGRGRPLSSWLELCHGCGLQLRATTLTAQTLPCCLAGGGTGWFSSFSLPRLAGWLDEYLRPAMTNCVFARTPVIDPPWLAPEQLLDWRPVARFIDASAIQPMPLPLESPASIEAEIQGVLPAYRFVLSRYLIEIIRRADGRTSLRKLMEKLPSAAKAGDLLPALHFLHHCFLLELLPAARAEES